MKKPKSTVKRMVDYFKQNPIPLAPQANLMEVRRTMKGYARAFKINVVNDRDTLIQLQETRQEIGRFLKRWKWASSNIQKHWRSNFVKMLESRSHICIRRDIVIVSINMNNIRESLELSQQEVLQKVANWMSEASGWVVNQVQRHSIAPRIAKFKVWSC